MVHQKISITLNILLTFKFWGIYFKIWNFLKHLLKMPDVYSLCVKIKFTLIKMLQNDIFIIGIYWNRGHKCEAISKIFDQNSIMKVNYVVLCFLVNITQIYIWESSLKKKFSYFEIFWFKLTKSHGSLSLHLVLFIFLIFKCKKICNLLWNCRTSNDSGVLCPRFLNDYNSHTSFFQ